MDKINLLEITSNIEEYYSPTVIGSVNDVFVKVAKCLGEDIPWHNHEHEDELFYIIDGELLFEEEGKEPFILKKGDLYIVKKGVNHRVSATQECKIMLIENKTTAHTGSIISQVTKSIADQQG